VQVRTPVAPAAPTAPAAPATAAGKNDINALEKQLCDLQKLMLEAQKAKRADETSQAEAEPTSEPGAGLLEVSTSLFLLCKRTS
jgi:hypothetical protein